MAELAGLAGLLDLPATPGTRMLAARLLIVQRRGPPTVLAEEEDVFHGVIEQIDVPWTVSSPDRRPLR